jgi:glycosyltransferase involved in cell wall biosynthesis
VNVSVIVATYSDRAWADRAAEAARSAEAQHPAPRETILLHLDGGTLAEARNAAAAAATSDWLCFLDADDELAPGYLAAMQAAYERDWPPPEEEQDTEPLDPDATASWLFVPALQRGGGPAAIPDWDRLLVDLNCAVIGTLVRRDLFLAVGGFREWPVYEDWDLWLRCVRAGAYLLPVPEAVYRASVNPAGRNLQDRGVRARTYAAIRAEHADIDPGWWRTAKVQP